MKLAFPDLTPEQEIQPGNFIGYVGIVHDPNKAMVKVSMRMLAEVEFPMDAFGALNAGADHITQLVAERLLVDIAEAVVPELRWKLTQPIEVGKIE